ncbi:hypothetical protein H9P43_003034 [Blastocladiella emersonii ATCC 22665]|nr:hypothetical protein H9P43_003034 [Blastocladiella emersonii ATCC 22665]
MGALVPLLIVAAQVVMANPLLQAAALFCMAGLLAVSRAVAWLQSLKGAQAPFRTSGSGGRTPPRRAMTSSISTSAVRSSGGGAKPPRPARRTRTTSTASTASSLSFAAGVVPPSPPPIARPVKRTQSLMSPPLSAVRRGSISSSTATTGDSPVLSVPRSESPVPPPLDDALGHLPPLHHYDALPLRPGSPSSSSATAMTGGPAQKYKRALADVQAYAASGSATASVASSSPGSVATALPDVAPLSIVRTPASTFAGLAGEFAYPERYMTLPNGLRVHYIDVEPPGAASLGKPVVMTVVLLHGSMGWMWSFRKVIPMLLDLGYRVVAVDYPGHGKSDKPMQSASITLGLYVATVVELFASILHAPVPGRPGRGTAPVLVLAQGFSAAVVSLALKESRSVSRAIAHLVLVNGYAPPHSDAKLPWRTHLAQAVVRSAAEVAHTWHGAGWGRFVPSLSTAAAVVSPRGSTRPASPSGGAGAWDVPFGSHAPVAPLVAAARFPLPWIGEVPVERLAALVAPAWLIGPAVTGTGAASSVTGGGPLLPPSPPPTATSSNGSASTRMASASVSTAAPWEAALLRSDLSSAALTASSSPAAEKWAHRIHRVAQALDRPTAVDLEAAKLHLREWAQTPVVPPVFGLAATGQPRSRVLVVWGAANPVWPVELGAWWADLCDARLVVVPGAGQYPAEDAPVLLMDAVRDYVEGGAAV